MTDTATYSTSLASAGDRVRFYIGDVDTASCILADAEIAAVLALYPDEVEASCECLESILSRYAHVPSSSNLSISVGSERYKQLEARLAKMRRLKASRAASRGCSITVGGRLLSERDELAQDQDVVQPEFTKNENDHPATAYQPLPQVPYR